MLTNGAAGILGAIVSTGAGASAVSLSPFMRCSRKISTAATPYCSLHPPPAALANVPASVTLRVCQLPLGRSVAIWNCLRLSLGCSGKPDAPITGPPRYVPLRCPKSSARCPLAGFRPLPLLFARFFRRRRRSQTSPLRVPSIFNFSHTRLYTIAPSNARACPAFPRTRVSQDPAGHPLPCLCRVDRRPGMDYSTGRKRRREGRAWTNTSCSAIWRQSPGQS